MTQKAIHEFVSGFLETSAFQRLRNVSFLGIVDRYTNAVSPTAVTFSRAEHTIGVLSIALRIISKLELDDDEAMVLVAASLVHDLAHPAFSHSLEYAFSSAERTFDHHSALGLILFGESRFSKPVLRHFKKFAIDPSAVYRTVSDPQGLGYFFHNPINMDTIDGISRSIWSYGSMAPYNIAILIDAMASIYSGGTVTSEVFLTESDKFWGEKDAFYNSYLAGFRAATELSFQAEVRRRIRSLDLSFFEMTDSEFALRYPEIILNTRALGPNQPRRTQSFVIDESITSVDRSSIYLRYRRIRENIGPNQLAPVHS